MATMNFSVPEDVKERFNQVFARQNKSAVVTALLEEAIERAERKARRDEAIDRILARMDQRPLVSAQDMEQARQEGRP